MTPPPHASAILIEIGAGELIDRLSILEIKVERLVDAAQRKNVRTELDSLKALMRAHCPQSAEMERLAAALKKVNETLWVVEDRLRELEAKQDFGEEFVKLARSVYHQNDKRSALKREINELTGARRIEEKIYAAY